MERRDFFRGSAAAAVAFGASSAGFTAEQQGGKDLIELRRYFFPSAIMKTIYDNYLAKAAIPALNRLGIGPVGVMEMTEEDNPKLEQASEPMMYVLLPHKSAESVLTMTYRLANDPVFIEAGRPIHEVGKNQPVYTHFDSSLLLGFDQAPRVEVPTKTDSRLFQLRIYQSHTQERALMKINMFNDGEIALFRKVGMNPVFFGQAIIGQDLPHLTYMLGFENAEAQEKAWAAFRAAPEWKAMSSDPKYADTTSKIQNIILRPMSSSQI